MKKITKDAKLGIFSGQYVANIYKDKIVVVTPYVTWIGDAGRYAEHKDTIRDQSVVSDVLADLADGREADAWRRICNHLADEWMAYSGMT
jgi:hypothetical protein